MYGNVWLRLCKNSWGIHCKETEGHINQKLLESDKSLSLVAISIKILRIDWVSKKLLKVREIENEEMMHNESLFLSFLNINK